MTDEAANPIFEMLRRIDLRLDRIEEDVGMMRKQLTVQSGQLANIVSHMAVNDERMAGMEVRIERIERRLNL